MNVETYYFQMLQAAIARGDAVNAALALERLLAKIKPRMQAAGAKPFVETDDRYDEAEADEDLRYELLNLALPKAVDAADAARQAAVLEAYLRDGTVPE